MPELNDQTLLKLPSRTTRSKAISCLIIHTVQLLKFSILEIGCCALNLVYTEYIIVNKAVIISYFDEKGMEIGIQVRPAMREDVPSIRAIYNDAIINTTAVYSYEPVTLEYQLRWFENKQQQNFPVFVAEGAAGVVGFSSYGSFRAWPAYSHTVENSVYVNSHHQGQGIGKLLISPLIEAAVAQKIHAIVAGIDATNIASIRLHNHFGFLQVAHFKEVGFKFNRWLDLVFMELLLDDE